MFIRAHQERKLELMVTTLRKRLALLFALDHQNYARWLPIHIRDSEVLPYNIQVGFEQGYRKTTRSNRRFSSIYINDTHEQPNKRVKEVGCMIGLTRYPDMLERWIITCSEIRRVVEECTGTNDKDDDKEFPHHEEGIASQDRFQNQAKDLLEVLLTTGNPFEENNEDLVTLDNKVCVSAAATVSVHMVESIRQEQYNNFRESVLDSNDTLLTVPIKRNNLLLFHERKKRRKRQQLSRKYSKLLLRRGRFDA